MSGSIEATGSATRRGFMRGAGVVAGGAAFLGSNLTAEAQKPQVAPAQQPPGGNPPRLRASAPVQVHQNELGPLHELGGTWVGRGFNLISLPDFDNPSPVGPQTFRVKLNTTTENLEFTQIGGNVPNRGSTGQNDINIFGLSYLQRVSDLITNGALHIEPGLWLHVPSSTVPAQPATVVRQGSIPHGTSILAQGGVIPTVNGGPIIQAADPIPFNENGPLTGRYLDKLNQAPVPPFAKPEYRQDPNLALKDAIKDQNILRTEVLDISTVTDATKFQGGGLLNIPFLKSNADATQFKATFWIETVQQKDGSTFMQLQYTQTTVLFFANISWPHISVATLVKQ